MCHSASIMYVECEQNLIKNTQKRISFRCQKKINLPFGYFANICFAFIYDILLFILKYLPRFYFVFVKFLFFTRIIIWEIEFFAIFADSDKIEKWYPQKFA